MKTFLRLVLLDLAGVGVSEGSTGERNSASMPRVCWIGWHSVVRTHVFIQTIWFRRERHEALSLLPPGDFWSMVKSDAENIMKAGLEDYQWRFESPHC
jgi:hypothetical protein